MAQGPRLTLSLGYAPSEVVSLLGGAALVKTSTSFLRSAVCFSPNFVIGLVGVRLRRAWVRSAAACVAASFENSIGKISVGGGISVVSETLFFILGM